MVNRIAISDIHGCSHTFHALLDRLSLSKNDRLYLIGDYIDRGPGSKEVVDTIMAMQKAGYHLRLLRGNHEDMLLEGLTDDQVHYTWTALNGGNETLQNFSINHAREFPKKYLEFFKQLEWYIELEDYILVHAGFDFSGPDPFSNYSEMVWIREFQVDKEQTGNRKIIHGHTPVPFHEIHKAVRSGNNSINIDNGCVYPYEGLSGLVALNLDNLELIRQPNIDNVNV